MSDLDLQLGKWLVERRPALLSCDPNDMADALSALAATLGCLLASVMAHHGDDAYRTSLESLFIKVDDAAQRTFRAAALKRAACPDKGGTKQ